MGTSPRRSGGLATIQRRVKVIARTTEATVTRARCAESMWSATPALGQTMSAFSGLAPDLEEQQPGQLQWKGHEREQSDDEEIEPGPQATLRKCKEKPDEDDDPRIAEPDPGRKQRR